MKRLSYSGYQVSSGVTVRTCVCACMRACMRTCVRACMCVCAHIHMCVHVRVCNERMVVQCSKHQFSHNC